MQHFLSYAAVGSSSSSSTDLIGTDRLLVDFVAIPAIPAMARIEEEIRRMLPANSDD